MQIIFKIMLHLREYELLSQKRSQILKSGKKEICLQQRSLTILTHLGQWSSEKFRPNFLTLNAF